MPETLIVTPQRKQSAILVLFLSIILLLSLWRLAGWAARFGRESLQMDLSAFYTAGEALNHGLSPYRSHVAARYAIWDGVDLFEHSRFLYPPQTAVLFRPLAWMPYSVAKRLWMGLSLAAVAASLFLAARIYGLERAWARVLIAAIFCALYYPLLTHLERGQIDAPTLLLIVGASVSFCKRTARAEYSAGVLLCAASLLKLHCVYMLPFLAIRKKGRALLGYLAGGVAIVVLTAVTPGGVEATVGYVRDELPRISLHGEWGTDEMRVDEDILKERLLGVPEGATVKDGVIYQRESFSFFPNGTLVRVVQRRLQRADIWISRSLVSAALLGVFLIVVIAWQSRQSGPRLDARGEFLYWQVVALIVLLSAPLTWVMNLVWLLPLGVVVLEGLAGPQAGRAKPTLILAAVALVVIAAPDGRGAPWMTPGLSNVIQDKYVVGELLLLFSLLGYLARCRFPLKQRAAMTDVDSAGVARTRDGPLLMTSVEIASGKVRPRNDRCRA